MIEGKRTEDGYRIEVGEASYVIRVIEVLDKIWVGSFPTPGYARMGEVDTLEDGHRVAKKLYKAAMRKLREPREAKITVIDITDLL